MKRLIIAEKPVQAREFYNSRPEEFNNLAWITFVPYSVLRFHFPRDLPFSKMPFNLKPAYLVGNKGINGSEADGKDLLHHFNVDTTSQEAIKAFLISYIAQFDEIYFAMDADGTGQFTGYQMSEILGIPFFDKSVFHLLFYSLSEEGMQNAWSKALEHDPDQMRQIKCLIQKAKVKRYFDYQWSINSLPLSHALLKESHTPDLLLTKFHIQALMLLEKHEEAIKEGKLMHEMCHYTGTGKYSNCEIGSPASRYPIIEQLILAGLITYESTENPDKISLSYQGRALLSRLHKKFKDRDLPGRLNAWIDMQVEDDPENLIKTQAIIDRYINTLFGKQKNFMNSMASETI